MAAAEDGLYRTPRRASGISATMTSALNTMAEVIADCGLCRCMMLSASRPGNTPANIAGMIAKCFATSLAMENVVSAPRVISICLPISTISMSLVGLESRSTMLPASLAADVPVFMATPTSAWASAGASLVPSPVIATSLPPACSFLIRAILSSGVASARKSSTPDSSAMALAVSGLSPVIMTVRMPMARISPDPPGEARLAHAFRYDAPPGRPPAGGLPGPHRRSPAAPGDAVPGLPQLGRQRPAVVPDPLADRAGGALPDLTAVGQVDPAHPGLGRGRHELGPGQLTLVALAQLEVPLGQDHDRPALRRLVGQAGQLGRVGQLLGPDPRHGDELAGLPVADGDGAGLVQQQGVDVAGRLDRTARHGQHVALAQPVHAGDADGRQQRPDRGRDQRHDQRDQDDQVLRRVRVE